MYSDNVLRSILFYSISFFKMLVMINAIDFYNPPVDCGQQIEKGWHGG